MLGIKIIFLITLLSTNSLSQEKQESLNEEIFVSISEGQQTLKNLQKAIELTNYGDYEEASKYYNALDTSRLIRSNDSLRMMMLESRSFMNKVLYKFNKSLEDLLVMLQHFTDQNDFNNIAKTESLLAEFYRSRGLKEMTFRHLKTVEEIIARENVDSCNIAYWYSRKAASASQFESNKIDTEKFIELALNFSNESCPGYTKALLLNELAYLYGDTQFDSENKIIALYKESISILESLDRQRDIASVASNLVIYYLRRGYEQIAYDELVPVVELAKKNKWDSILENLFVTQMTVLVAQNRFQEAYEVSREAYLSKVALMENQYAMGVEELQAIYDRQLAEKALAESELRAESNEKALTYTIMGTSLFAISTLTAFLLFIRVRRKNHLLNEQQKSIELTNEQLSNSLDEKELLYKELNHRVKNNLMVLSGLIYLQQEAKGGEGLDNDLYTALRNRIQTMAIVHEKLYAINSTNNINFQEYLEELIPLIYNSFKKGDIIMPYTIKCMTLFLPINKAIPLALIFNELITNSIKHSTEQSLALGVVIKSETDEAGTFIEFKDLGSEISEDINFSNTHSMGMKIVNLMTQQLKATLEHQSTQSGLIFTLKFN